jgi:hypothetical protein
VTVQRMRGCRIFWTLLLLALSLSPMRAQVQDEPPTNLQVFQRLAKEIGADLRARFIGPAAGKILTFPREIGLPLEQDLLLGLGAAPGTAYGDTTRSFELAITEAQVTLEDVRRDGFLGPSIVDRVVRLAGTAKGEGTYVDFRRTLRDTVRLSDIDRLASPSIPFTRMSPPARGFFDNLLEPLVVLGSVGVAVYLLFAVRS